MKGRGELAREKYIQRQKTLTSSAVETQRGSSMPISHWCSAAIVNLASRCALGMQVSSWSVIAPPASSKSHADGSQREKNLSERPNNNQKK